jgi:hypothetical protein
MLHLGRSQYPIPNPVVQVLLTHKVNPAAKQPCQLVLDVNDVQADNLSWLKRNQYVNIAVRPEVIPEH